MAQTYTYATVARPELLDELLAAGIADARVATDATTTWVTTDADRALVDPVVAAHKPAVYQAQEDAVRTAYNQAIQFLQTFSKQTPGTATNAQQDRAIGALITVAKAQNQALREQGEVVP